MVTIDGFNESFALLQVWGTPPNVPPADNFGKLGTEALVFSGAADLQTAVCVQEVAQKRDSLDDSDDPFTWDLDIKVGPFWRKIAQAAPLVVVSDIFSSNTDDDDNFEAGVQFRSPPWTAATITVSQKQIVLHVTVKQAGEYLNIRLLSYTVTATGELMPASLTSIIDKAK
jgi:hypothetical protein